MIERIAHIAVNGTPLPAFLCTPDALDELAVGYLLTQGYVASASEIMPTHVDSLFVQVATKHSLPAVQVLEDRIASLAPVRTAPFLFHLHMLQTFCFLSRLYQ